MPGQSLSRYNLRHPLPVPGLLIAIMQTPYAKLGPAFSYPLDPASWLWGQVISGKSNHSCRIISLQGL